MRSTVCRSIARPFSAASATPITPLTRGTVSARTPTGRRLEVERRALKDARLLRQKILPGVSALLTAGRKSGLRIGLASNSAHAWVEPNLKRLGLHDYFEFFACREDAASPKPEPDLYKLVLQHMTCADARLIAFEDSQTGVLAANRAGLWIVAAPNPSTATTIFSLAETCGWRPWPNVICRT